MLYYKTHRKRINFYGVFNSWMYNGLTCVTKNAIMCVTKNVMVRWCDKRYIYKTLSVD